MTVDYMRWVVEWCTTTGSLLFIWEGAMGNQPVMMPGYTYYWWLDDDSATLYEDREGSGGSGGAEFLN